MKTYAEYVSPGHPDRLADAIAEGIVTEAVKKRHDALVGVEVAVHRDVVFIDGRIAAGSEPVDKHRIVRGVYEAAGYGGTWIPDPSKLRIVDDLCEEALPELESDIRPFSDDQNIVIGYACSSPLTNHLPAAHWLAGELGRRLFRTVRNQRGMSEVFGPDFKILATINERSGKVEWDRLVLSILHRPKLPQEEQHRLLLPHLLAMLAEFESAGLEGVLTSFHPRKLVLNGAGEFAVGGPEGDNGLSGKKTGGGSLRAAGSDRRRCVERQRSAQNRQVRCAPCAAARETVGARWRGRGDGHFGLGAGRGCAVSRRCCHESRRSAPAPAKRGIARGGLVFNQANRG